MGRHTTKSLCGVLTISLLSLLSFLTCHVIFKSFPSKFCSAFTLDGVGNCKPVKCYNNNQYEKKVTPVYVYLPSTMASMKQKDNKFKKILRITKVARWQMWSTQYAQYIVCVLKIFLCQSILHFSVSENFGILVYILSRASEVGSPTNRPGSRQRQDTGPWILWSVHRWTFKKKRTAH